MLTRQIFDSSHKKAPAVSTPLSGSLITWLCLDDKVYTRDRKGAKAMRDGSVKSMNLQIGAILQVPDRLKVVRAFRVQNLQNWTEFMKKQQSIKQHIETLRQSGNKGVCKNGHELAPLGTSACEHLSPLYFRLFRLCNLNVEVCQRVHGFWPR